MFKFAIFVNALKFLVISYIVNFDSYLLRKNYKKKIIINFVTSLLLSKRREIVYNSILIIVDYYTKIIKYIFVIIRIDVAKLAKVFFKKIVLYFETSIKIVSNRNSIFTSAF